MRSILHPLESLGQPIDREPVAQAFFNQHNLLIMVSERKATRFGRRVRARAIRS